LLLINYFDIADDCILVERILDGEEDKWKLKTEPSKY